MANGNASFERAMKLAVVCGLRAALGPALVAAAHNRPERQNLAMAALGEMVLDKMPLMPSRAALPLMLPRAYAGYWVTKTIMEEQGEAQDPWVAPMGAAVAAGVSALAPRIRGLLHAVLGMPNPVLGLAEDYLALRLGGEALGLSNDDLKQIAGRTVEDVKELARPALESIGAGSMLQSVGAGSM